MTFGEHVTAIRGDRARTGEDPAARRSNGQPGANGSRPEYLRRIDELLGF
jgi:hypothetical protein